MHERNCTVFYTLKNLLGYHPLRDSVKSDVFLQVCSHLVHLSESKVNMERWGRAESGIGASNHGPLRTLVVRLGPWVE